MNVCRNNDTELMYNYEDNEIGTVHENAIQCCSYCMRQFQCPFNLGYRQETEWYQRQMQGPPTSPPPSFTPQLSDVPEASLFAVDPGAIAPCVNRLSYIWLENGQSFWAYLVYVGRTSASGWRYTGRQWVYFGIDLKEIKSFTCY